MGLSQVYMHDCEIWKLFHTCGNGLKRTKCDQFFHLRIRYDLFNFCNPNFGKSILQVPDTGTWVLDNTKPFLHSSIVCFWMPPVCCKKRKYHIFGQYWYTRNAPVFNNTGTFQYLGPEVYFFPNFFYHTLTVGVGFVDREFAEICDHSLFTCQSH